MKFLHIPLSDHGHEIIDEIKFLLSLPTKAEAVEKALEIAIRQIENGADN